jgi:tetratricopeptide (TPR) repeat protein
MAFGNLEISGKAAGWPRRWAAALALGLFGITLAAYAPALRGGLQWDDAAHVTKPALRGLDGLRRIWCELGTTQQYYPVLHSAFWLEHRLWGDSVLGYHLVNVLLHAGSACLFALLLARIRAGGEAGEAPGVAEWLAAAVFALHPVCVESVAWISEQKNTLSLFLYLLAALAYLGFDRSRRPGWYALASGLFALALLSKSVTATLPAALLLALAWRNGRIGLRRDVLPLVPWLAAGAGSGLFTAWVERTYIGARGQAFDLGVIERCLLAGRVVWFYIGKLVWPVDLTFIYPRWQVVLGWRWGTGLFALVAAASLLLAAGRRGRAPLLALLFFVGSLFPVLGFVNVYPFLFSYVADHWQYLPSLGLIALACLGGASVTGNLAARAGPLRAAVRGGASAAAAGILVALFALTWRQSRLYRDVPTLYADTLAKNPGCWMAHNNLGVYLNEVGSRSEAIAHLRLAVALKPDYADAHNNLGNALAKDPGQRASAVAEFEAALRLQPGMSEAEGNLGLALVGTPGRLSDGIGHLEAALRGNEANPEFADLHADLAAALARVPGRLEESTAHFEAALRMRPGSAAVLNGLGAALARTGRAAEAEGRIRASLALDPGNYDAHNNLGNVLTALGRVPEAVAEYRRAIALKPDFAEAHVNLGRSLRNEGDGQEAIAEYRRALVLVPGSAEVRNSLGSVLLRVGRVSEALGEYSEAVRLDPGSAAYLNNLGIALTREGRLDEAIARFRAALDRSPGYGDAHYNLGVALEEAGQRDAAAAEFSASGRPMP